MRPTPRRRAAQSLVAAVLVLLTACTAQPALPDFATATARPADPTATPAPRPEATAAPLGPDLRVRDFGPGDPITFATGAGDVSWSIAVRGAGPDDLVGIRRVVDPAGETRYAADLRNELLIDDELHPRVLADAGAVGLYVTSPTGEALEVGIWEVDVVGNEGDPTAQVVIRTGDTRSPQSLDVVVWSTAPDVDVEAVQRAWRDQADAILAPHDLAVGELDVQPAGEAGARWVTLGLDELASDVHAACEAAAVATAAPARSAVVVLVDRIGEGVLTADALPGERLAVRRPEGDIDGFAVATPGTPVLGPASHACVAVAARGEATARGAVALHEVLHLAGLTRHTTEREGRDFDRLPDTPECPAAELDADGDLQVSRIECADRDAPNLMFWAAGGLELTADQAWRVRQHPLLRSTDAGTG